MVLGSCWRIPATCFVLYQGIFLFHPSSDTRLTFVLSRTSLLPSRYEENKFQVPPDQLALIEKMKKIEGSIRRSVEEDAALAGQSLIRKPSSDDTIIIQQVSGATTRRLWTCVVVCLLLSDLTYHGRVVVFDTMRFAIRSFMRVRVLCCTFVVRCWMLRSVHFLCRVMCVGRSDFFVFSSTHGC